MAESDLNSVLADSLYEGYLDSHKATIARLYQHDALRIPREMAFRSISGLSNEIVERLDRAQPQTFGEARRLPGLTPGALSTLLVYLSAPTKNRVEFTTWRPRSAAPTLTLWNQLWGRHSVAAKPSFECYVSRVPFLRAGHMKHLFGGLLGL